MLESTNEKSLDSTLRPYFKELIKEVIAGMSLIPDRKESDTLFNIKEASAYLHLSISCLHSKTSKKLIPFIKTGKNLIFSKSDLDLWIHNRKKPTANDFNSIADEYLFWKKSQKNRIKKTNTSLVNKGK